MVGGRACAYPPFCFCLYLHQHQHQHLGVSSEQIGNISEIFQRSPKCRIDAGLLAMYFLPCRALQFAHCFGAVTHIAACCVVVEVEPEIRPVLDRNDVLAVKVSFSSVECLAKEPEDLIERRLAQLILLAIDDDLRSPATVHARPIVPLEGQDPHATVVGVIAAFARRSAAVAVNQRLPSLLAASAQ